MAPVIDNPERAREQMVASQIAARGILDPRLHKAMLEIPREAFVPEELREFAYADSPLPIEAGQTISQPYIVAHMIEAAGIGPGDRVLEVGAGSGYAAAVIGRLADEVYAIERHEELADLASERMRRLGFANVAIRHGDGTRGWPEAAPFDVILVAARGAAVPQALRDQLAPGGRLVIPVGPEDVQTLKRYTKMPDGTLEEESLGSVRFVPLIADAEDHVPAISLPRLVAQAAEPLPEIDDPGFADLFERFGGKRVVLLGEATHGSSEFYRARTAITRRLIERHGFTIVAVEADWPDAAFINRQVRHLPMEDGRHVFRRFPTWMWRNRETAEFTAWLRAHNRDLAPDEQAGFYGLDLYNLSGSIHAVTGYLDKMDPEAAAAARRRYGCLEPWVNDPARYGRMALTQGYAQCEEPVIAILRDLLARELDYAEQDGAAFLDAAQNARLVRDAEAYYRAMYYGAAESWNLRDRHMFETLEHLLEAGGTDSKAVVWAHNSHIGDARFTEMGQIRNEFNIGQLARERFGEGVALIGFGTHEGEVAAADEWDGPMARKRILPSRPDSYERIMHDSDIARFLLDFGKTDNRAARAALSEPRLERYIGVIYRPETERLSHYSAAILSRQYDGYVWFDRTGPVIPFTGAAEEGPDEMYPFGL